MDEIREAMDHIMNPDYYNQFFNGQIVYERDCIKVLEALDELETLRCKHANMKLAYDLLKQENEIITMTGIELADNVVASTREFCSQWNYECVDGSEVSLYDSGTLEVYDFIKEQNRQVYVRRKGNGKD